MQLANGTMWNPQLRSRKRHRLMNAHDAAQLLGKTRRTICRRELAGKMPKRVSYRGRMLYRQIDIEEMARRLRATSPSSEGDGQ